jgi:ABC-2 type transport system permease protein
MGEPALGEVTHRDHPHDGFASITGRCRNPLKSIRLSASSTVVSGSIAATAISIAIGVPLLMTKGVDVTWSASAMAEVVGRLVAATVLWTAIGVGVGLAVKHQVAAIAGTLVWLLAAEGILSGLVPDVAKYFPGAAGFAIVGINPADLLTPALGALLLGAYALVAVAAGGVLMQRRDIT